MLSCVSLPLKRSRVDPVDPYLQSSATSPETIEFLQMLGWQYHVSNVPFFPTETKPRAKSKHQAKRLLTTPELIHRVSSPEDNPMINLFQGLNPSELPVVPSSGVNLLYRSDTCKVSSRDQWSIPTQGQVSGRQPLLYMAGQPTRPSCPLPEIRPS